MDFLGFLRGLFGGDQKPAAPSEQVPELLRRPAEPKTAGWMTPAVKQSTPSYMDLPSRPPASSPAPQQEARQTSPGWLSSFPLRADTPAPTSAVLAGQTWGAYSPNDAAPPKATSAVLAGQTHSPEPLQRKMESDKQTAEVENAFFGDEGQYVPEEMSVEKYLNLAPRQRAAVDANTALVAAAKQDTASATAGKPADAQDYDNKVTSSFGDKGGSDIYAPRTMAVLENLGLDLQGRDLDQYLNFSGLVTADDLSALTSGAPAENPRQQNAVAFAEKASARLSETLANGQTLLDSIRTGSDTGRQLFGEPTASTVGFTASERDKDLRDAFNIFSMAQAQADLTPEKVGGIYAELQEKHSVTPNEVAQYFDTRLQENEYRNAMGGTPVSLGEPGTSHKYLSPEEFRAKFLTRGE